MQKRKIIFGSLILLIGISICVGFFMSPIFSRWRIMNKDLDNISVNAEIDNTILSLECNLYRNFMPSINSNDPPLKVNLNISSNISSDVFSDLQITDFWALNGNVTWHRYLWTFLIPKEDYNRNENSLFLVFRNGPATDLWNHEVLIDVILRVRYKSTIFFLKASDLPIVYLF